jgi:hypothetical protein
MTPYITFREMDDTGNLQYYILQREFPHYIGVIRTIPLARSLVEVHVSGYNLYLSFAGTLRGNMIPSFKDAIKEMVIVYQNMATWYLDNRITKDEKRFKKFKIN